MAYLNQIKLGSTTYDVKAKITEVILNDSSNYKAGVQWRNTTLESKSYLAQVGRHNTGGNGDYPGSISIIPYATDTSPWNGKEGLFITKDNVKFENQTILHSGNYTDYTVTKNGTGATGLWGIDISGNAATATTANKLKGNAKLTSETIDGFLEAGQLKWATADQSVVGNDGMIVSIGWSDAYGAQLWFDDGAGEGGMKIRNRGTSGASWNSWRQVLTEYNYNSYSPTLTGTGATGTWGINISGNAATSSSCSGNAATATKLTSSGGSSLIPVYFSSGKPVACTTIYSGKYFGGLTSVGSDGVMEIGKYVDFHNSNADTSDYSTRLMCTGTTGNVISLPTATGTMALTSDLAGYLKLSGGTMNAGKQIARAGSSCSWYGGRDHAMIRQNSYTGYNPIISAKTTDGSWELGPYTGNVLYFVYNTDTGYNSGTNTSGQYFNSVKLNPNGTIYGAVWNDYAEFRICNENFKPGQVVLENGDDTLSVSTERLQRGCSLVSDTFGFAIGETDEAKCPIAVSGRVLAYGHESREEFKKHIGWPVCSGPNGTVSIMTEEEEEKYPSRIIGTISAVPDYKEWGAGNIKVDNRIWIKVK